MKRIVIGTVMFLLACTVAVSQVSLLNEATNGLFKNVNDFVIKPNVMFNTVETKQVIIGGGFNDLSFKSNTNGGGLIGYYHPGKKVHWSVAAALDMKSEKHNVESVTETNGTTTNSTEHKNPAFNNYAGGLRFNIGFPDIMNLSAGIVAHFEGKSKNEAETTQTKGNTTTTTIAEQTKELDVTLGIPVSIQFTPTMHNFFEPYLFISQDKRIVGGNTATNADAGSEKNTNFVEFALYDKFTMQNLFPAPFGADTSFWLGLGVGKGDGLGTLVGIAEIEKPAYKSVSFDSIGYEVKVATQLGMSNLLDFSAGTIQLRVKPMTYFDFLFGVHKSFTFGATVAIAAGAYAPLSDLPLALFFGVTPGLQFYNTVKYDESSTVTTKSASRALTTSAFWSGKVGISVLMPQNMAFDITLNVNDSGKSIGLSALMAVSL